MEQEDNDDKSTDEEGSASERSDDENDSGNVMSNDIEKNVTFLLGRTIRYGRAVRLNFRLLF